MWFVGDYCFVYYVFFYFVEQVFYFVGFWCVFFFGGEISYIGVVQFVDFLLVGYFVGDGVGVCQGGFVFVFDGVFQFSVFFCWLLFLGGGVYFGGEFVDCLNQFLYFLVIEQYCFQYLVFVEFLGFGFYYQYGGFGIGDYQVESGFFQFGIGWVEQVQVVFEVYVCGVDGIVEWNV